MTASATLPLRVSRRPGLLRLASYVLAAALGGATLLAAAGASYEALASGGDAGLPRSGRLVDVAGLRMHIDCRGTGSPTVILDSGLGGSSLDWVLVQDQIAQTTRVCSYDRAGMGWSDPGQGERTPSRLAGELHALLAAAGERGPYVLVGHSLAGKNVRMFAATFPAEVGGLVLVDARNELIDARMSTAQSEGFDAALKGQATAFAVARSIGLMRLAGPMLVGEPLVPSAVAQQMALLQSQPSAIDETSREGFARAADDAVLARSDAGSLPMAVIAAGQNVDGLANWEEAQQAMSKLSSRGRYVLAEGSGHYVQLEQPQLVVEAVRQVVEAARGRS